DLTMVTAALKQAASNWNGPTASCAFITLELEPPQAGIPVGYNAHSANVNLIKFVSSGCPHDPASNAITTTTFNTTTGQIFDADMELNAESFQFAVLDASGGGPSTDIENTVTHELGHLLGLDHTCDDGLRSDAHGNPPVDNNGQTIPRCCPSMAVSCNE